MGWLAEDKNGKELILGDEPLDLTREMLRKIAESYSTDFGRKPKADEIAKTIEMVLAASLTDEFFQDDEDKQVSEVIIKLKKRLKRQVAKAGDYYAIPLPSGLGYGFVRTKYPLRGYCYFMDVLDYYSAHIPSVTVLSTAPVWKEVLCSSYAINHRLWHLVGNIPLKNPPDPTRTREELRQIGDDILFNRVGGEIPGYGYLAEELEEHHYQQRRISGVV